MSKKYFVISDIHGHYDEMIEALKKYEYDCNNPHHHLIVIGDMFDRGTQSKEVLEYLHPLTVEGKATVILGNHDNFLIELLNGEYLKAVFNITYNGTDKTLSSLVESKYNSIIDLEDVKKAITLSYPYLEDWLKTLPLYLEIGNYIFVHGGINGKDDDWREGKIHDFVWNRQINLEPVKGKTMVVGHHRNATIRYPGADYKALFIRKPEAFEIIYEDGKIFIDSYVEVSKMINVLVRDI